MAQVKIEITNSNGEKITIEREVITDKALDSFNNIEAFTLQIRRELFPELQKSLLEESRYRIKKTNFGVMASVKYKIVGIEGVAAHIMLRQYEETKVAVNDYLAYLEVGLTSWFKGVNIYITLCFILTVLKKRMSCI